MPKFSKKPKAKPHKFKTHPAKHKSPAVKASFKVGYNTAKNKYKKGGDK